MPSRLVPRLALPVALVLALAACSAPPVPVLETVRGTIAPGEEFVLGVGLAFAAADAIPVAPSFVLEPTPGFYLGELVAVDPDGVFTVALPAAGDVPAAALAPASSFLLNTADLPGCALVPNVVDARVSTHVFSLLTLPGLYAVTAESGLALTVAGTAPFDTSLPPELAFGGRTVIAWLFADREVDVASQGAGCSGGDFDLDVDLRLGAGWNQVAWRFDDDFGGARLRTSSVATVVVTVLPGWF